MDVRQEDTSGEIKHLKRCLNDLVSVLALPAMWSGSQPSQIVHTLLDALLGMLCLDLVYARLEDPAGGAPIEVLKIAPSAKWMLPDEIHKTVNQWFGDDPQKWPSRLRASIGDEDISIVSQRCGLHGEIGVIVAGSQRADFPEQTETLLLSVAANQAVIGLHEARLLLEQKRVAGELDRRVAQRTAELAAVNDELRKEIAERHRAEEALLENELNSRLILHSIPGLVCTMSPAGEVDRFNPQILEYFGKTPEELKGWATSDAVHPDDLPRVVAAFTHSITTGTPYDIEHRCRRADGVYRWFQVARPSRAGYSRSNYRLVRPADGYRRSEARGGCRPGERARSELDHQYDSDACLVRSSRRFLRLSQPALARLHGPLRGTGARLGLGIDDSSGRREGPAGFLANGFGDGPTSRCGSPHAPLRWRVSMVSAPCQPAAR